jgi:hypothetical protein
MVPLPSLNPQEGGFLVKNPMNKEAILEQYKRALGYTGSVLMVITEPFTQEFVNNADPNNFYQYFKTQNIGLYYTRQFEAGYDILLNSVSFVTIPLDPSLKVVVFTIKEKSTTGTTGREIKIANWHGNSSGTVPSQFKTLYDWAIGNKVDYITGDSNITMIKSKISIEKVITDLKIREFACSHHVIEKDRWPDSILMNNQVDKKNLIPEVDGMFIVKVEKPTTGGALNAFETQYSKETPILADHNVVQFTVDVPRSFILMAASGAALDDPTKGILLKDLWNGIKLDNFHKTYDKPYTVAWRKIYNTFIDSPEGKKYSRIKTVGGRTKRRKGKKTRKRNRRNRTRHNRQNHTRTWSSSR